MTTIHSVPDFLRSAILRRLMPLCIVLVINLGSRNTCSSWSNGIPAGTASKQQRRDVIHTILHTGVCTIAFPSLISARNLPEASLIDRKKIGTVETLLPIVRIQSSFLDIEQQLVQLRDDPLLTTDEKISKLRFLQSKLLTPKGSSNIPVDEDKFKLVFDAYSDPVSYKQKFADQNAFLVYYTKGFDGFGRPSIENDLGTYKQTLQYSARNEVWISWEEFLSELQYQSKGDDINITDLIKPLAQTSIFLQSYLDQAPEEDIQLCYKKLQLQ